MIIDAQTRDVYLVAGIVMKKVSPVRREWSNVSFALNKWLNVTTNENAPSEGPVKHFRCDLYAQVRLKLLSRCMGGLFVYSTEINLAWTHIPQERLKRRNTLGCLDQYAAQNSKYARPPIPSQPPIQKGLLPVAHSIWSHHETFTLWNSLCRGAVPMAVLWIGSLPPIFFNSPNLQTSWSH